MDNFQEYLIANLPPGFLDHVTTHGSTYWAFYQRFLALRAAFYQHFLSPLTIHVIYPLTSRIASSPDLTTLVLLLIILVISLKVLGMLVRTVMWWVRLITRLVFWAAAFGLAVWLWQRGLDGAMSDFEAWRGVWTQNYDYWRRQELNARHANGIRGTQGAWWAR